MTSATKLVRIDLGGVATVADLYAALESALDLPGHFGRNLDALWDVLTRDLRGPAQIEFIGTRGFRERSGEAGARVLDLFVEVAAERDDVAVAMLE